MHGRTRVTCGANVLAEERRHRYAVDGHAIADLLGSWPMSETIPAVFENGVFRALRRPRGLVEHHHVTLTVDVFESR